MQRIVASVTQDRLTISQSRSSHVADACANTAVALVLLIAPGIFGLAILRQAVYLHSGLSARWLLALPYLVPAAVFAALALRNIYVAFTRSEFILDRAAGTVSLKGRINTQLSDLQRLRLKFTGYTSPSRYALIAEFGSRKPLLIASTGYFGSRLELEQLSSMIAEFTARSDLYAG